MSRTGYVGRGLVVALALTGMLWASSAALAAPPASSPAAPQQSPAKTLTGNVIAARTGKPLANATVYLIYSGPQMMDQHLVATTTSGYTRWT